MKEIGWEQQIDQLLYSCRITEAREVFLTRGNKRAENYMQRLKMFNLNAGWIMLMNSVDYEQVVSWFKKADIDPREIILLFKDLFETSLKLQANHLRQRPKAYLLQTLQNN